MRFCGGRGGRGASVGSGWKMDVTHKVFEIHTVCLVDMMVHKAVSRSLLLTLSSYVHRSCSRMATFGG